ncbi:transcriptional regulator [Vibrio albus]|uniref:Transcriptional regulator n=1 Tax=Vibrio albus TaxID=2200953 RepID=A0A2U3B516_9VIBR|nr:metalloregulator ArsR/SmtB family transcription factor [Vibrio albus]PWI31879.1 transcriptional regulator [Vibrio albus]
MCPAHYFKMLSDETRIRCLLLVAREEGLCVSELTHALAESQPKISRHLAQLRQCGFLVDERDGARVRYKVSEDLPGWFRKVVESLKQSECLKDLYREDIKRLHAAKA